MRLIGILGFLLLSCVPTVIAQEFIGELILKPLPDGRKMQLVKDFGYKDKEGRKWVVPSDWVVDGASIPRPLWSFSGGPYSGKYRDASVIHDYFCDVKRRPWDQVHKLFYEVMLLSGVDELKAKVMYLAVYRFGPRWDFSLPSCPPNAVCDVGRIIKVKEFQPLFDSEEFDEIKRRAELLDPYDSMELIEHELDYKFTVDAWKDHFCPGHLACTW